jgi:hypothetical protein
MHRFPEHAAEIAAFSNVINHHALASANAKNETVEKRCCDWMSPCCNTDDCSSNQINCYASMCGWGGSDGGWACVLGKYISLISTPSVFSSKLPYI